MLDELWEAYKSNREMLELAFRSTVSETKQNIDERLNKIFDECLSEKLNRIFDE